MFVKESILTSTNSPSLLSRVLRGVYAGHAAIMFCVTFVIFFPLLMIPVAFPKQHHMVGVFNRWWAHIYFSIILLPYKTEYRFSTNPGQQYIFCPNHFSYLDIPAMGLNKSNAIFVGKSDMESIPLFGFMYKKLHITVNRESLKSRYTTLLKAAEAIDQGKSLMIFPEGGILTSNPPTMTRFKDGAFRTAIEKQIPIVPVTIPYNWIILPDSTWLPRHHPLKVIFHEPIETKGLSLHDLPAIKAQVFTVIETELNRHLK